MNSSDKNDTSPDIVEAGLKLTETGRMRSIMQERVANIQKSVQLDSESYGAPPENSGIEIVEEGIPFSLGKPQCAVDKDGNWFYSFEGARMLARVLGRTLPNIESLGASIYANRDMFRDYVGYRAQDDGKVYCQGHSSSFWSSDEIDNARGAEYAFVEVHNGSVYRDVSPSDNGMSVRFIVDKA